MSCAFMHVIDVPFANHSGTVILAAPINKSIITGLDFVQRQWINAMALTDKEVQTMAIGVHRFSQEACHVQIYLHCPSKNTFPTVVYKYLGMHHLQKILWLLISRP